MEKKFVAINYISCEPHYRERFEQLFGTRAHAIDLMPGFVDMQVLKPNGEGEYLIVSHWTSEKPLKPGPSHRNFWKDISAGLKTSVRHANVGKNLL